MFQRLRTAHPLGYCLLTEVLFLALIMVGPLALLYALAFLGVDISRLACWWGCTRWASSAITSTPS